MYNTLREMFQYSSFVKKPLDQSEIATHGRTFQIQDKSRHGLVKSTYSGENCWCPWNGWDFDSNSSLSGWLIRTSCSHPPFPRITTTDPLQPTPTLFGPTVQLILIFRPRFWCWLCLLQHTSDKSDLEEEQPKRATPQTVVMPWNVQVYSPMLHRW